MRVSLFILAGWLAVVGTSGCTFGSSNSTSTEAATPEPVATSSTTSQTSASSANADVHRAKPAAMETEEVRTVAERLEDASVETRVRQALVQRQSLRVFDFQPTSVRGTVTIRGDVNSREQRRLVARVARSVDGVDSLANEVTVRGQTLAELEAKEKSGTPASEGEKVADASSAVYYTVQSGDTLWNIARDFQASVQHIKDLNDLRSGSLQPGQRIRIR